MKSCRTENGTTNCRALFHPVSPTGRSGMTGHKTRWPVPPECPNCGARLKIGRRMKSCRTNERSRELRAARRFLLAAAGGDFSADDGMQGPRWIAAGIAEEFAVAEARM